MEDFDVNAFSGMMPPVLFALMPPIVVHILYVLLAPKRPRVALAVIALVTILWMPWAAYVTYGPPFGPFSKTAVSLYIALAAALIWLAHHLLIRRAGFSLPWLAHGPVIFLFGFFAVQYWTYHIAPRLEVLF